MIMCRIRLSSTHFDRVQSIVFNVGISRTFIYPPHLMNQLKTLAVQRIGKQLI